MIVITLTDCPPNLRGDLSKWLCEINTGVYVGNISSRVRDELWDRICDNLKNGRATMVFHTNGEQQMDFRVHNTTWTPVDFDGIKLMRHPLPKTVHKESGATEGYSKAAQYQKIRRMETARNRKAADDNYTVVYIAASSQSPSNAEITEISAIRVRDGQATEQFHVTPETEQELQAALAQFTEFVGKDMLVGYQITSMNALLRAACRKFDTQFPTNRCADIAQLARKKLYGIHDFQLNTLGDYFSFDGNGADTALEKCKAIHFLYTKLNEK
jgi:CRISPR-associated protein Cas2